MRIKHKKLLTGTAAAIAGVLGAGALLQTSVSVQASAAMMPGIETIVKNSTEKKPFRILELVDNSEDAEIGYYVSGQEPSVKLYEYQYQDSDNQTQTIHFSNLEEGLSKLPEKQRKEFAMNVKLNDDGSVNENASTRIRKISDIANKDGKTDTSPLSYTDYQEKYFLSSGENEKDGWKKLELKNFDGSSRTDTVQLTGNYVAAESGDYTKEKQEYYPIRRDSDTDASRPEKYRENIQNFYFSEGDDVRGSYYLQFEEVSNKTVNKALNDKNDKGQKTILPEYDYANGKYGYYENVYTDLTSEIVENIADGKFTFPGEQPEDVSNSPNAVLIQDNSNPQSASEQKDDFNDGTGSSESDSAEQSSTDEFGSGSDQSSVNDVEDADVSGGDDFGTGDTQDGGDIGDISDTASDSEDQSSDPDIQDAENGDSAENLESNDTAEDFSGEGNSTDEFADAESGAAQQDDADVPLTRKVLGKVESGATAGSQSDPYIYLGETIEQYPFYKYTLVGDLAYLRKKVQESTAADEEKKNNDEAVVRKEGDITLADDQYWYWKDDGTGSLTRLPLSVVTGRQPVSYNDIQQIPEDFDYNYYYRVEKVWFCCQKSTDGNEADPTAYTNFGWYYPSYPDNEDVYLKVNEDDGKTATHYISDAEYKLTPGKGNYNFVQGEGSTYLVEVNHIYYRGGYTNNDWLKRYVFHLSPDDKEFSQLNIQVDTKKASDLEDIYATQTGTSTQAASLSVEDTADQTDEETDAAAETQQPDAEDFSDSENTADQLSDSDAEDNSDESSDSNTAEELSDDSEDNTLDDGSDSAQSAGSNSASGILADYDLIYINGELSEATAALFANSTVPCIVNTSKLTENSVLAKTFKAFIKDSDTDGHYVNRYMYFFKNTQQNTANLVNTAFHTNFNTDGSSDTEGFEEILTYINSENRYRELGTDKNDSKSSSDSVTDGTTTKLDPLTTEISQARAVEYIINYQYKRNQKTKSEIKVLEIEPYSYKADETDKITEAQIAKWIGTESATDVIQSITTCCYHTSGKEEEEPDKALKDGDSSTIWHSAYNGGTNNFDSSVTDKNGHINSKQGGHHWLKITLKEAEDVKGLYYQSRQEGKNGVLAKYKIELWDENGKSLGELTGETGNTASSVDRKKKEISFDKTYSGVKTIKLTFVTTLGDSENNKFASCAEIGVDTSKARKVTLTTMTAAEFVGHKDDIASEYDMIYVGGYDGARDDLINGERPLLYAHVGAAVPVTKYLKTNDTDEGNSASLLGQLDNEYDQTWAGNTQYEKRFAPTDSYSLDGAGYFRGSGNDMTQQQCEELVEFVKSGYPVVFADNLVSGNESDRTVNTEKVDASSWYYKFIKEALKYDNAITWTDAARNGKLDSFYVNLAKPQIRFAENGRPPHPERLNKRGESGTGTIQNNELKYVFTIENDSDAAPAVSTYDCKLYFDLNFDGNLSENEVQDKYVTITDSSGKVLSQVSYGKDDQRYELKLGEQYTVTRKIPKEYYKLITWKLVISSNNNKYIYTSETGYSKQANTGERQIIKVLQIVPDNGGTWDLTDTSAKTGKFQAMLANVEDFDIRIEKIKVSDYAELGENAGTKLKEYDILIIGFDDVYQNIPNTKGQVDAIKSYIRSGRSVIFSHDTTSYLNYEYGKKDKNATGDSNQYLAPEYRYSDVYTRIAETEEGYKMNGSEKYAVYWDKWLNGLNNNNRYFNPGWGISLNKILRSVVGMDRYGITADETLSDGKTTISSLLKRGHEINSGETIKSITKYTGDAAYKAGDESRSSSYAQTHGLSNGVLRGMNIGTCTTNSATKVNEGAITEYPYAMSDSITISTTHGQYYQLALEQDYDNNGRSDGETDIVVWYCLTGGSKNNMYSNSPNDARNYYYYYSRGNVIYTGTGHSNNENNEQEIQLFINSIVAAANVSQASPDVNFVKSLNPSAETESVHYYMTDQSKWIQGDANTLEPDMDLYINVKDYNMVSSDLNQEDLNQQEMTLQFYIEDENGTDPSADDIKQNPSLAGKKLKDITGAIGTLKGYGTEGGTLTVSNDVKFHTKNNNAYALTIPGIENYLRQTESSGTQDYRKSCKVYVKVSSTVYLYGEPKTSTVWSSVDLKQRQLFDMD